MLERMPTLSDLQEAAERVKPFVHQTPVLSSEQINEITGKELFFKCENLQKVGAFKFRGACNAVFSLSEKEASKGVATHSSGNHAAALALAAKKRGISAHIVMPRTAPEVKKRAVAGYGGIITFCEPTLEARESTLAQVIEQTGALSIHPYDNYTIIAGQSTSAQELLKQVQELDVVMTPVGGGGLLSGTALAVKYLQPNTKVYAAEPLGADDAYRSIQAGRWLPSVSPNTICDGLLTSLGQKNFPIIQEHVDKIITVSDESVIRAMRLIWERMKIIIEPSSAVCLAAILEHGEHFPEKRIGIILSGGNVDLGSLPFNESP